MKEVMSNEWHEGDNPFIVTHHYSLAFPAA